MRQLSFLRPGRVDWESVPDPVLTGPDTALLRPLAVARCDLDIAMASGIFPGPYPVGHEVVGEVVAVGVAADQVVGAQPVGDDAVSILVQVGQLGAVADSHAETARVVDSSACQISVKRRSGSSWASWSILKIEAK
jgi:threonine dehydrogenase-like Zn-dependent dehydrogenase